MPALVACLAVAAVVLNILCNPFTPLEYLRLAARAEAGSGPGSPDSERRSTPPGLVAVADIDDVVALPSGARPLKVKALLPIATTRPADEPADVCFLISDRVRSADVSRALWRHGRLRC